MKRIILISSIIISVVFIGCKKKSTSPSNSTTTSNSNNNTDCGQLTLMIDGITKTLTNQKITLTKLNSNNVSVYSDNQTYYDFQIWGEVDGGNLAIDITNFDWQNPLANTILSKTYYNNSNLNTNSCKDVNGHPYCQEFVTVYNNKNDANGPWATAMEIDDEYTEDKSFLEITKIDGSTKKASGTFEIKLYRDVETDTTSYRESKIVKGTFTNLCYITQ
jgi:hypothetical protein